jgi:hypothetical protein
MIKPNVRITRSPFGAAVCLCSLMITGCSAVESTHDVGEAPFGDIHTADSLAHTVIKHQLPETLEEHVAERVRQNSHSAAAPIVIGTIGDVADAGVLQPHQILSPEEVSDALGWIAEESGIDIEATFGPDVTPSATEIVERADPFIVEDYLYGPLSPDVHYTTFVVHIERVLLDDDSNLREAETLLLREVTDDDTPPITQKGDRYLLMLDREPDGAYGFWGPDNGYRLMPDCVTDFRGKPPRLAADVAPEPFVARVAQAIPAAFARATDIAERARPTGTPTEGRARSPSSGGSP